jgi:hypothetical protein
MANTNDFVAWAIGTGANILTVANYQAATIRQQGAQIGIADPLTFNNAMRQSTSIAAMIAQFTADHGPGNVQDNGDLVTLESQFVAALTQLIDSIVTPLTGTYYHFGGTDTGTANHYVLASPSPAVAALVIGTTIIFKPANSCTGASDLNTSGLGAVAIVRQDGSALQIGDITSTGFPVVAYDGTHWVLIAVLQTVAGVPVATTTANGISREATTSEMQAGATSGSVPAFATPEGLKLFADKLWTYVVRAGGATETAYNEMINITAVSTAIIQLMTPVGVNYAYEINNSSSVNQTITTPAGVFSFSFWPGFGTNTLTVPANTMVRLRSDGTNWVVQWIDGAATTADFGYARLANDAEGTSGVTNGANGPSPAVMTPERVALFFFANVANTTTRGIAREATTAEMTAGATSGSSPAFVTPEGLALYNPFTSTGVGAIVAAIAYSGFSNLAIIGDTGTLSGATLGGHILITWSDGTNPVLTFYDTRWLTAGAIAGTWKLINLSSGDTLNSDTTEHFVLQRIA